MKVAFLDFPWDLTDLLNDYTEASRVMLDFEQLVRRFGLKPAAFVDHAMQAQFWERISELRGGANRFQPIRRFLEQCSIDDLGVNTATPEPPPEPIHDRWKRALRQSMHDLSDWRRPQIVVPTARMRLWVTHDEEAQIRCSDDPATPHSRVVASLDAYGNHPHAHSDFDPWDLQRRHPAPAIAHANHPCNLPKPPMLHGVDLPDVGARLKVAQAVGWQAADRRWFIPPDDWTAENIPKVDWRQGDIFAMATLNNCVGYRDYFGNVWAWDAHERHWDVQLETGDGTYIRVSHTGRVLGAGHGIC